MTPPPRATREELPPPPGTHPLGAALRSAHSQRQVTSPLSNDPIHASPERAPAPPRARCTREIKAINRPKTSYALRMGALLVAMTLCLTHPSTTLAQQRDEALEDAPVEEGGEEVVGTTPYDSQAEAESDGTVTTSSEVRRGPDPGRASSTVTREAMRERLPRSAPDALRYEPGVFVQQTAHSQGSAFIRGRTGQQTIMAFDDVRLNNSLFRQGPNQYFFTIDARTIDHIDIMRGSSSTRYGTDAVAGVINAVPIGPRLELFEEGRVHPTFSYRYGSADAETGGRAQVEALLSPTLGILAGAGARRVGLLEGGGQLLSPETGELPQVPRYADDGRTQLGTGFDELTADARLVWRPDPKVQATLAAYTYRQHEAPRTDQCPPAYAPFNECLTYDDQFRDLVYGAIDARWGWWADSSRLVVSWQRQYENRRYDRPTSRVVNRGEDQATTSGMLWRAETTRAPITDWLEIKGRYGADYYRDRVESSAEIELLNIGQTVELSRGQYIHGSSYGWGGVWSEAEAIAWKQLVLRAGGRLSHIQVYAPADEDSGTRGIQRDWSPWVGNAGVEWWANSWLTLQANADQAFRAPNLDDLTSRQRTGPGFQIENADLEPERGETLEVGARASTRRVEAQAWAYRSTLRDAIVRTTRDVDACPINTPECSTTWSRLQLVNLPGTAVILGAEGSLKLNLPARFTLTSTLSYAWGDGPAPVVQAQEVNQDAGERQPLSRVPPLNGTVELMWRHPSGGYLGGGTRWARTQDRLAISDVSDERIPQGGTPGFAVLDARAGWRGSDATGLHLVFENLTDTVYRYHGSSTNGAGRSLTLQAEIGW